MEAVLVMKEPSLSLEHWQGCPTFKGYSKLTHTQLFSIRYPVQLVVTKDSGAVAICVTFTF